VRCDAEELAKFELPKEPFVLIVNPPTEKVDARCPAGAADLPAYGKAVRARRRTTNYYYHQSRDQFEELFGRAAKKAPQTL
jgi:hypothetical protein